MHTKPYQLPLSQVRTCYPESYKYLSSATHYGCQYEADSREGYKSIMFIFQYCYNFSKLVIVLL